MAARHEKEGSCIQHGEERGIIWGEREERGGKGAESEGAPEVARQSKNRRVRRPKARERDRGKGGNRNEIL